MSSMDRARGYLKGGARKLALVIVPLAAVAVTALPARADNPFGGNGSGGGFVGVFSSWCTTAPTAACWSSGSGSVAGLGQSGVSLSGDASGANLGSGIWDLIWGYSGQGIGETSFTQALVSYDFTVTPPGPDTTYSWALTVTLDIQAGPPPETITFNSLPDLSGELQFSGTGPIVVPNPLEYYYVNLDVTFNQALSDSGGTASVNIPPATSVDVNATVPEPSALLCLGTMLGGLLLWKRSRTNRA